jgi:hypothetical protein
MTGFATNPYISSDPRNPYQIFDRKATKTPYLWTTTDGGATWQNVVPVIKP